MGGLKKNDLVSVCIPTYNGENFIEETIGSVRKSSYQTIEIIIFDDCSSDHTREIIGRIRDNRIRLFSNEERLGVPANWNRAVHEARGDCICFLNHDDLISPFWLSYVLRILKANPRIGWVVSAFHVIDRKGSLQNVVMRFPENRAYTPAESFPVVARLDGLGPGFVARKNILSEIGFFDKTMGPGADNELFLRLAARYDMFFSTTPHTSWRRHTSNLSHKWVPFEQVKDGLRLLKKIFNDPDLPLELKRSTGAAYFYFYAKILKKIHSLLQKGDLESVQKILTILNSDGPDPSEIQ
jgi:glycosyltransferase involved in cell wall biosynthesis